MSADSRGILRGQCQACNCDAYSGGEKGFKCLDCGHPPGKHVNLSTSAPSSTTGQVQPPPQLQAVPSIFSLTSSLSRATRPTPVPSPPTKFAIGPQCQVPGCMEEAHFDLNSMKQYPYCKDHINVASQLQNTHINPIEYGEPLDYPGHSTYPQIAATNGFGQFSLASSPPYNPAPYVAPQLSSLTSQSTPNLMAPQTQPFPSLPPKISPHPLGTRAKVPKFSPSPVPPSPPKPSVPPDQQCILQGCTKPKYVEPGGKVHDFCGRSHAQEYRKQQHQSQGKPMSPDMQCKTPGCPLPRRQMNDGSGYYDYCSLSCRDTGQRPQPSASLPNMALSESGTCSLPGCERPKYVDPANNRTHDFCGRSHANQAQLLGIALDSVSIVEAGSKEFQKVSGKFQQSWARQKGSCPTLSLVFVVRNRKLEQRWTAYRQKLASQGVEEHYHGTVLMCDITSTKAMCNVEDCGICGISKGGFDRRCIHKNINFQRFGHGFYLAPNSSKCHDYTQGFGKHRAMLLCNVCPGNKYVMKQDDVKLKGPPQGYDSVHGQGGSDSSLNYDELVIYNPDSILPRYIVVYQKNGIHKIAK